MFNSLEDTHGLSFKTGWFMYLDIVCLPLSKHVFMTTKMLFLIFNVNCFLRI